MCVSWDVGASVTWRQPAARPVERACLQSETLQARVMEHRKELQLIASIIGVLGRGRSVARARCLPPTCRAAESECRRTGQGRPSHSLDSQAPALQSLAPQQPAWQLCGEEGVAWSESPDGGGTGRPSAINPFVRHRACKAPPSLTCWSASCHRSTPGHTGRCKCSWLCRRARRAGWVRARWAGWVGWVRAQPARSAGWA